MPADSGWLALMKLSARVAMETELAPEIKIGTGAWMLTPSRITARVEEEIVTVFSVDTPVIVRLLTAVPLLAPEHCSIRPSLTTIGPVPMLHVVMGRLL
jgi:hypothetical protein